MEFILNLIIAIISMSIYAVITIVTLITIQFVVYQLTGISLLNKLANVLHWVATAEM